MFLTVGLGLLLPLAAHADMPGRHPAYLHALSDLRAARWMIEHRPADAAVSGQEDVAISEIDHAIDEIKHAAYDDGKDLHDHPQVDLAMDQPGRLHQAADLLAQVHNDIDREEDDPETRELKHRALWHVDEARHAVDHAIHDVRNGR
ncbi:hypothetical protein DVT68_17480 [Dyella solisilvae]|uniref:DUF4142 domain-containing protein n=2 Tax=Dyella solisilvae TaxID=1920168 RepID=A0A370K3P5_9GAMM|nr:hypothetical protein DVT68_17480 [Dyella solisilvae]